MACNSCSAKKSSALKTTAKMSSSNISASSIASITNGGKKAKRQTEDFYIGNTKFTRNA